MKKIVFFIIFCCVTINLISKVQLPAFYSSRMVLQQQSENIIKGKAEKNKKVTLRTSWDNRLYKTKSDTLGQFEFTITTPSAGGPYYMEFSDGEILRIHDVLIGELWLCSGQSNMEMPVRGFKGQPVYNSHQYIMKANGERDLRLFTVKRAWSKIQKDDVEGEWMLNTHQNVSDFSAVAYFFGNYIQDYLGIPVGLICSSWSASNIEAWMSEGTLRQFEDVDLSVLKNEDIQSPNTTPTLLYNAMIHPFEGLAIKGIIWYQGESNSSNPEAYRRLFPALVKQWRDSFNKELPVYYVQIAPYQSHDKDAVNLAEFRQVQMEMMNDVAHVGMAVTADLGSEKFIHPPHKIEVGERLALWALAKTYNIGGFTYSGPIYSSFEKKGAVVEIKFDYGQDGLVPEKENIKGFEIAGKNGVFYSADAEIIPASNIVKVWSDEVSEPTEIRYCFRNYKLGTLKNNAGLPASPFKVKVE